MITVHRCSSHHADACAKGFEFLISTHKICILGKIQKHFVEPALERKKYSVNFKHNYTDPITTYTVDFPYAS